MLVAGRAAVRAARGIVQHARLMSTAAGQSGGSSGGNAGVGMKAATAVAIGSAVALFASEGLGSSKVAEVRQQQEQAQEKQEQKSSNSSDSSDSSSAPASVAASSSSELSAGTADKDLEPSYDNLNIKEADGHIVLEWDQNGIPFRQVFDQNGNTVAGPGAVGAPAPKVRVVETSAAKSSSSSNSAAAATHEALHVSDSGEPLPQDELLKNIVDALSAIERDLNARPSPEVSMDGFPRFTKECKSLLKKHLTPDVYLACAGRVTPNGFTFDQVIQSGIDNQDSGVGCYAGDEESYTVFAPLFDKVIEDYHNGYKPTDKHVSDMDSSKLGGDPDVDGSYVISTRIRVGRNIRGLGLSPGASRAQRREVERIVVEALSKMDGDLKGKYFSLANMSEEDRTQLVKDHFLFKKGDRFLQSAGANRDWPESRGIFHNNEKTFLVWVNEEDQMRIISMQKGSDAKQVFSRLARGIDAIENQVKAAGYEFAHNDHLGYIHSCPTNCGTGMRASVHVKLPNVGKHPEFKDWCAKLRLQPRGIHGEHSESEGGVYDISNKERLGRSEVELVQTMIDGVKVLIEAEKALASDKPLPEQLK